MKIFLLNFLFFLSIAVIGKCQDSMDSIAVKKPKTVTGIASFYSLNLTGTKTATGERFDNKNMTAASNSFKLNTWVRVTNLRNDKSVIVRINDRMSKHMAKKGRVIDLSRIAARKLQFMKRGLVKVRVEEVNKDTLE
ncbi:MAG: septal ring lytic transglycosylase RlpA family protein [Hydrotalea sp. AMD]|uniref:septal ring lytic transglycosylase RlpA family protein n=1 Tax=Hydrotalea sp. AMD TaxID=2501297 RepID=UPI000942B1D8|nr:septal ring lytic transglycosylase RlpA family protein [Hydrotalea sp. AMD]RWZ90291.1 MAG: septal ring lytic transglycosylase RlpA family protein [Hydrotalea sp. AMD]